MSNNIKNNEAISIVILVEILKKMQTIENAKYLLILPLIYNNELISFLRRGKIRSLEELIVKKSPLLTNFNEHYHELLPVALNTLVILDNISLLKHENGNIIYLGGQETFNECIKTKRAEKILEIIDDIIILLSTSTENLYLQLRIIL